MQEFQRVQEEVLRQIGSLKSPEALPSVSPSAVQVAVEPPSSRVARRLEQLLDKAEQHETEGDYAGAVALYDDVLVLSPGHPEATSLRALAALKVSQGLREEAAATVRAKSAAETRARAEADERARNQAEAEARAKASGDWSGPASQYAMKLVPAQTFQMGSTEDSDNPVHTVTLSRAFWIGVAPVYQSLWSFATGTNPSSRKELYAPATDLSWYDAVAFANKLSERDGLQAAYRISGQSVTWDRASKGYRLPTEAEWECAARAGHSLKYAGSNDLSEVGWYDKNSGGQTHPVLQKKANAYGLHDMSGNVWEWCWDWYDGLAPFAVTDPGGPASASLRVGRGGSWRFVADFARVAFRRFIGPTGASDRLGARIVRST